MNSTRRSSVREVGWVVLYPLAVLWAAVACLRRGWARHQKGFRPSRASLVVGNLHSGGSGKTPLVCAIVERLVASRPVTVSRGYRARLSRLGGRLDENQARAFASEASPSGPEVFGDEPWMIFHRTRRPVYVGANRVRTLKRAQIEEPGELFVLDDGFSHLALKGCVQLVVIGAHRDPFDSFCLPYGDLREPLSALKDASAVVGMRGVSTPQSPDYWDEWRRLLTEQFPSLRCFEGRTVVRGIAPSVSPQGIAQPFGAFCGIAHPQRFLSTLRAWDGSVSPPQVFRTFADHFPYGRGAVQDLIADFKSQGLKSAVTTEKDWHKVAPHFEACGFPLFYLQIDCVVEEAFWTFLETELRHS